MKAIGKKKGKFRYLACISRGEFGDISHLTSNPLVFLILRRPCFRILIELKILKNGALDQKRPFPNSKISFASTMLAAQGSVYKLEELNHIALPNSNSVMSSFYKILKDSRMLKLTFNRRL